MAGSMFALPAAIVTTVIPRSRHCHHTRTLLGRCRDRHRGEYLLAGRPEEEVAMAESGSSSEYLVVYERTATGYSV